MKPVQQQGGKMRIDRTNLALFLRSVLFTAAVLVAASPAAAAGLQNPELAVHVGEGDDPAAKSSALAIGKLDIDVEIMGDTARTVVSASFLNSSMAFSKAISSSICPPGSVVTGYALDIDGKMVDGVLVGHRQGTITYESRVRRGIDPGLAEVTRAGAFTTRVYPILQDKGRTVRLEFVTPLEPDRPFTVPLATQQPVGAVSIHIKTDSKDAPHLRAPEGLDLQWTRSGGGFEARASAVNRPLSGALVLGPVANARPLLLARHHSGDTFFEINDVAPSANRSDAHPGRLRIYWDSSLSRRDANLSAEIDLVGRYIAAAHPDNLDIVFFSTDESHLRSFRSPGAAEVMAVLKTTDYQGGTSLKPLFKTGLPDADVCLLFSDGNITVDSRRARRAPCSLYAISSVADADRALLTALAHKTGGDYADLGVQTPEAVLAGLLHRTPRVVDVKSSDGRDVDYAVLPAGGNRFRIIGRLPSSGEIVVNLTRAAQNERRYAVDSADARPGDALGALWAARHVDEMSATDRPDQDDLLALSRRYSVASTFAAFVVFENISDYVEAQAEPPATLGAEKLAEFRKLKAKRDAEQARAQGERLDKIVKLWAEEKQWWQTKFKPVPRKQTPVQFSADNVLHRVPPPPPPPPPAMAMAAPRGDSGGLEAVVVTGGRARSGNSQAASIEVTIAPWNPDRPYIKALDAAGPDTFWNVYRSQEREYGTLPAFYLDVAEFMFRHGRAADAIRIALNALELPSANTTTMTILADRTHALWRRNAGAVALRAHPLSRTRPSAAAEKSRACARCTGRANG